MTYWTTAPLEPLIEAVSKEVYDLAAHFRGRIFGVSPHLSIKVGQGASVVGFNPRFGPLLRLMIPLLERATDINHVYAEVSPWLFSRTLGRKPIVLTIASEKGEPLPGFFERCAAVVVQTSTMARKLAAYGIAESRLRLIYPGVDLSRFRPRTEAPASRKPRVLLATFPRTTEELASRGVLFLLDVASRYPDIQFSFVSRPWRSGSSALEEVKRVKDAKRLTNLTILEGVQRDMQAVYLAHDFTVIPFTTADGGKECPRSLVETLACGVPVLISSVAPFSSFVTEQGCGKMFDLDPASFAAALDAALSDYASLSLRATDRAYAHFDLRNTMRAYADVYDRLR